MPASVASSSSGGAIASDATVNTFAYSSSSPDVMGEQRSNLTLLAEVAQDAAEQRSSAQALEAVRQKLIEQTKESEALVEALQKQLEQSRTLLQSQKEQLSKLHCAGLSEGPVLPEVSGFSDLASPRPELNPELRACQSAYSALKKQLKVFPQWLDRIRKQEPHGQRVAQSLQALNLLLNKDIEPKHHSLITEIEIQDLAAGFSNALKQDSLALLGSGVLLENRIAALRFDEALRPENQPVEGSKILTVLAADLKRTTDKVRAYQIKLADLHYRLFIV